MTKYVFEAPWKGVVSCLAVLVPLLSSVSAEVPSYQSEFIFPPEEFHNHSSSIVETPAGDLLACWFHGKGERRDDTLVIRGARKKRGESKWSSPFVMADNQDLPDQNCTLFIDPQERLWLFWVSAIDNQVRSHLLKYRYSTDYQGAGPPNWTWQDVVHCRPKSAEAALMEGLEMWHSEIAATDLLTSAQKAAVLAELEERRDMRRDKLFQRLGWMPRQPPIMLSENRMMLGLYSDTFDCAMFAFTENSGKTWEFSRPLVQFGIQPSLVQKTNGDLVAYMRFSPNTKCAMSSDNGMTWAEVPLDIPNSGSSVSVLGLKSGNWILAVNDTTKGRHQLSLYLSQDEGKTWTRKRYLERLDPAKCSTTSGYPTLIQSADDLIHVTYTYMNEPMHKGKTIKHAWFNETWINDGVKH